MSSHTILVVDDEPGVLDITATMLRLEGFQVVEVEGAEAALGALDRTPNVTLLVTDILMPGMNGYELARQAKVRCPGLRVLYTSGYDSGPHKHDHGEKYGPVLWKPYRAHQLVAEVRKLIDGGV